jgi:hypothetical protein
VTVPAPSWGGEPNATQNDEAMAEVGEAIKLVVEDTRMPGRFVRYRHFLLDTVSLGAYNVRMKEKQSPVEPEIVALIERTVRDAMEPFGLKSVDVRAGEDHDGDPVIFVEAQYDLSERPLELGVTGELSSVLWERLRKAGETRFAHVRHKFHEQQTVRNPARRARG